jgi:SAM-dependent methyltransferase
MDAQALYKEMFSRTDKGEDWRFYQTPRMVTHIDDPAIAALKACFGGYLPAGGDVLDLMSSWVSHYPEGLPLGSVTGLGLNRIELDANPRLTERVVHDLNHTPTLPFPTDSFDACTLTVSVQYLTQPVEVIAELSRVLRPGAPCIISYSNRCFPTKAIALWQALDDRGHGNLLRHYFAESEGFSPAQLIDLSPAPGATDPLYVAVAHALPRLN